MQKKFFIFISILIFSSFLSCGEIEEETEYLLTIDGYKENFTGHYKIDGVLAENFTGEEAYTDENENTYYYYDKELEEFTSIKVFAYKVTEKCSLTISIWKDDKEVETISSGENAGYNEDEDTYELAVGPLYYEPEDDETADSVEDDGK